METKEVIENIEAETQIDEDCNQVMIQRNQRVLSLSMVKEKLDKMWEDEEWALNWLDIDDVYLALNSEFIESIHV